MSQIVKKTVVCLLILTLLFSLGITAFAEGEQYIGGVTITINNAYTEGDEPYKLYRMLEVDGVDFRYKVDPQWVDFFTSGYGAQFITLNNDLAQQQIVTEVKQINDAEKFAQEAYNYVISKGLTTFDTTENDTPNENGAIIHKSTAPGYYLVVSPKGKICSAVYVNREAEINEKNMNEPSVEFYILDNGIPKRYADAQAGSIVEYMLKLNLVEGLRGFEVETSLAAYCNLITNGGIVIEGMTQNDYTESFASGVSYKLEQSFLDSIKGEKTVTVRFKAKLSNEASFSTLCVSGYNNHYVRYWYNELTRDDGIEDCIKLYTWDFTINDYIMKTSSYVSGDETYKLLLPNVHYILSRTNNAENPDAIDFLQVSNGVYRVATADDYASGGLPDMVTDLYNDNVNGNVLSSDQDRRLITLQGLDGGTYYLIQTDVPYGYSKNTEPIEIKLEPKEDANGLTLEMNKIEFIHTANSFTLPSTGGPGTILLMTLSLTLFVLTLAVIITKLRIFNKANRR